jgi:LysR family hydrogen peroxide-inducible transcriptional activator
MKWPNLKHLHYLVVLHQEQHFNRAAQKCHVSQSTLSTAIQNLEEQFGNQLLERDHKSFVFTSFGLEVVERGKRLLIDASEMLEFAESAGDWQAGSVKLGMIPTIAPFLFEGLIDAANEAFPKLSMQLQEDTTENLLEQLNQGVLDLLVLALPMETPGCKQMIIGHDPFHLIGHRDVLETLPSPVIVSQLPKESVFLLQKEHCLTGHAVSACGLKHREQVNPLAASSLLTLTQLISAKLGITFMPALSLKNSIINNQKLKTLPAEDGAYRQIGLVWRNGTNRMQLFVEMGKLLSPLMPIPKLFL